MDKLLAIITNKQCYLSLITISIGIILYVVLRNVLNHYINHNKVSTKIEKRRLTYFKMFSSILKYFIIIVVILLVLQINGFNITSLLTGLGVASLIAGLALQDALKDIIMGFNLIVDEYFSVGDTVKIGNVEGVVLELGLKTTKIKDIKYGNIYVIANRNISDALTISNYADLEVQLPYETSLEEAEKVIKEIVKKISKLEHITNVNYRGINEFSHSAILYRICFDIKPELRYQTKRDANNIIKKVLEEYKIDIPYQQIDIHQK